MLVTFDLDGVLVDTRRAVKLAYFAAGINMPPNAWGRPAREWLDLDDPDVQRKYAFKKYIYPSMLESHAYKLAGAQLAEELLAADLDIAVVTHASTDSATHVLRRIRLNVPLYSTTDKVTTLCELRPVCHIDDQPFVVPNGSIGVVEFENDIEYLRREVREWTRSSWQPATAAD